MKASRICSFRPIVVKAMLGFVLAAMISGINAAPASSDDRRDNGRHDQGRYENRGRGHINRGGYYIENGRRYYRPYAYQERVYVAPPPVIYAPPEPPGISFFFPPIIIR